MMKPRCETLQDYPPQIFIDAVMAKRNLGTGVHDAPIVIALGPGFKAGIDAHAVIETKRGPGMGRVIYQGEAAPNTGIPGEVKGYCGERVLRSPGEGIFKEIMKIGDLVEKGDVVAYVGDSPVKASIGGTIRGLLRSGLLVEKGDKLGDIHPEKKPDICRYVSDKAWAVGQGVLQAIEELAKSE